MSIIPIKCPRLFYLNFLSASHKTPQPTTPQRGINFHPFFPLHSIVLVKFMVPHMCSQFSKILWSLIQYQLMHSFFPFLLFYSNITCYSATCSNIQLPQAVQLSTWQFSQCISIMCNASSWPHAGPTDLEMLGVRPSSLSCSRSSRRVWYIRMSSSISLYCMLCKDRDCVWLLITLYPGPCRLSGI